MKKLRFRSIALVVCLFVGPFTTVAAFAHCDTMAGPVVRAARRALDTGDISQALRWVRPGDEAEVRQAFASARGARALDPQGKELSDRRFFETVVRLHRAGEGEPYTGLKDAPPEPMLVAADKALESGDVSPLISGVDPVRADGIRQRFARAFESSGHADESLAAGREYVRAYVEYIHYVLPGEDEPEHGESHAATHQQSFADSGRTEANTTIEQFSAANTRLKKNAQTKLVLAFRSEPGAAHIAWHLACVGVAISGWDAPQLLSVSERTNEGAIQAIDAHDYVVNDKPVLVVVKRPKSSVANAPGQCTLNVTSKAGTQKKTVEFDLP